MNVKKLLMEMTIEEKAGLCSGKDFWSTKPVPRLEIPSLMMCDGPHGLRKQEGEGDHLGIRESIKAVSFPTASAMASSFDTQLLHELGSTLGDACVTQGIAMLLGPGINMKRSPLCGRNFEYFSEDPYLAGKLSASYITGLQSKEVSACVKHFAVNNQETNRMSINAVVDERTLHEIYLPAFEMSVKEGNVGSVMCSYNKINSVYAAENNELLTKILRDNWGFSGFVVTDWGAGKDRIQGLIAGVDLEMPGNGGKSDRIVIEAVEAGSLDHQQLDLNVERLLNFIAKNHMSKRQKQHIHVASEIKSQKDIDETVLKEHHNKAIQFAIESAVLLKNEEEILPLASEMKIAVIGEYAQNPRFQGSGSSYINSFQIDSAYAAFPQDKISYAQGYQVKGNGIDTHLVDEAVQLAKKSEVVVIFVGMTNADETEGCDRNHIDLPKNQNFLIEEICKVHSRVVIVLHGGAPVSLPWIDKVQGLLCMHLSGEGAGKASVDLLYGIDNPSGKLAETWPYRIEDTPSYLNFPGERGSVEYHEGIYIGYRYYDKKKMDVQFPFGYGLSYTRFQYSDLTISKNSIMDTDQVKVSVSIKNTGKRYGKEVVQLYIQDKKSSVHRPLWELKGFSKIGLEAGEEQVVEFTLGMRSFAYYEPILHDWFVESGEFTIAIGSSSRNFHMQQDLFVEGSKTLPVVYSRETLISELMSSEKGRAFVQQMTRKPAQDKKDESISGLGEGSDQMVENMMKEMPLGSLVSFGAISEEQLTGILAMLNSAKE